MSTITCFGEALIDFLEEPAPAGEPHRYLRQAGGAPANTAVAVARLGGRAAYVGMIARDAFGDFLVGELSKAGGACYDALMVL